MTPVVGNYRLIHDECCWKGTSDAETTAQHNEKVGRYRSLSLVEMSQNRLCYRFTILLTSHMLFVVLNSRWATNGAEQIQLCLIVGDDRIQVGLPGVGQGIE